MVRIRESSRVHGDGMLGRHCIGIRLSVMVGAKKKDDGRVLFNTILKASQDTNANVGYLILQAGRLLGYKDLPVELSGSKVRRWAAGEERVWPWAYAAGLVTLKDLPALGLSDEEQAAIGRIAYKTAKKQWPEQDPVETAFQLVAGIVSREVIAAAGQANPPSGKR